MDDAKKKLLIDTMFAVLDRVDGDGIAETLRSRKDFVERTADAYGMGDYQDDSEIAFDVHEDMRSLLGEHLPFNSFSADMPRGPRMDDAKKKLLVDSMIAILDWVNEDNFVNTIRVYGDLEDRMGQIYELDDRDDLFVAAAQVRQDMNTFLADMSSFLDKKMAYFREKNDLATDQGSGKL